ncbi:MAG TPA: nucleoside deaminase [Anaerolineales bacterium]|nr:nucleoside deaminase [Anaerolineales bacterium]HRF49738.1 nucleoside deaminase [Anaerolineales bacterium]
MTPADRGASQADIDRHFMAEAIAEARLGFSQGGIPIGSVIVVDGQIIGRGHNQRVQLENPILHGEMSAFQNAGRQPPGRLARATLYTTLSPCTMCAGTALLYRVPRVVIGEHRTVSKTTLCEDWLIAHGVEVVNLDLDECVALMAEFINRFPELWNEDIGREHVAPTKETDP